MAHSSDYTHIYDPSGTTDGLGVAEVARSIGVNSLDIGTLCSHQYVRAFAKYKPQAYNAVAGRNSNGSLTDTERRNNGWGLNIPQLNSIQELALGTSKWSYLSRSSYWYRLMDFDGYFNRAPLQMLCPRSLANLSVNPINEQQYSALVQFYIFQKDGHVNFAFKDMDGSALYSDASKSNLCLDMQSGGILNGRLYGDLSDEAHLGLALNKGDDWYFRGCSTKFQYLAAGATLDNSMFNLNLGLNNTLPSGTYTAYPCVRVGGGASVGAGGVINNDQLNGEWYPMHGPSGISQRAVMQLKVGGTDLYHIDLEGVHETASDTPISSGSIYVASGVIYLSLKVTNNTGIQHITQTTIANWNLSYRCIGVVTYSGEVSSRSIDVTHTGKTIYSPASFVIAAGGYTVLVFRLDKIFNNNVSAAEQAVDSGSYVAIRPSLRYNSDDFTDASFMESVTIIKQ